MSVAANALYHSTSQLRRVELVAPLSAIGKNTIHSLQSGLVLGYAEMVRGMVGRFVEELDGGSLKPKVVATGGMAEGHREGGGGLRRDQSPPHSGGAAADPRHEYVSHA